MITVEKLEKGTYFDDAFKISFRYDPTTVAKVKELAERRYLPEDRAWEIPAHELPALIEKVGLTSGNPNLTDDSPKLDRIKEMLEEEIIPNGHKAIIFSQWSTIAKDLGLELKEYDPIVITGEVPPEQRQRLVDNFQTNPHCKVAIGTIGAMGTGLTL